MTLQERMEWEKKFEKWLREISTEGAMLSFCLATAICWMLETEDGKKLSYRLMRERMKG